MTSKADNKATVRRKVRRQENADINETSPTRDGTIGSACRRGWGAGAALNQRHDSVRDQLIDLIAIANENGMYDAADYLQEITRDD